MRRWERSEPYFALHVMYATRSPACNRGANLLVRQRQDIDGRSCSRSGSRLIDPSTNGGISYFSEAILPNREYASGLKELRKNLAIP